MSFMATAGLGVIAMVSLFFSLPKGGAGERPDVRSELAVLMRPQVLSALLTTVLGAGAMFTLYTYISPVLHTITHATPAFVTGMLVLIGVGFSIGNYLGGKLADRSVNGTLKGFLLLLMIIMLAIPFWRVMSWVRQSVWSSGGSDVCGRSAVADARDARCQRSARIIIVSQHWRV